MSLWVDKLKLALRMSRDCHDELAASRHYESHFDCDQRRPHPHHMSLPKIAMSTSTNAFLADFPKIYALQQRRTSLGVVRGHMPFNYESEDESESESLEAPQQHQESE